MCCSLGSLAIVGAAGGLCYGFVIRERKFGVMTVIRIDGFFVGIVAAIVKGCPSGVERKGGRFLGMKGFTSAD